MLKDPKNCAIVTVVFLVLVIGGLYMFRKSREGFQGDPNNPCDGCDADALSNEKARECAEAKCFDESSEDMGETTTDMEPEMTTTSDTSDPNDTSDPCEGCDEGPFTQEESQKCMEYGCWSSDPQ